MAMSNDQIKELVNLLGKARQSATSARIQAEEAEDRARKAQTNAVNAEAEISKIMKWAASQLA